MKYEPDDEVFASFCEERREFGFQRGTDDAPPRKTRKPWLAIAAALVLAAVAFSVVVSPEAPQDASATSSVR